jgi:hypothetical protein
MICGGMKMTEDRFVDSSRFVFSRGADESMYMVDHKKEFLPVQLTDELAALLSEILWEHYQFVNEKEKGLFVLNNLRDFVRANSDLDNDILIALIKENKE